MVVHHLFFVVLSSISVRYMLSYEPRLPLDSSSPPAPQTDIEQDDERPSKWARFFHLYYVAKLIYQVEGIHGYFKGIMPTIVVMILLPFIPIWRTIQYSIPAFSYPHLLYMTPTPMFSGLIDIQDSIIPILLYVPALIITYRAIATPERLAWNKPKESLQHLLTPAERQNPFLLWLAPGLLPAQAINAILKIGLRRIYELTQTTLPESTAFAINVAVTIAYVLPLAPLQLVITRLAVQRNYGGAGTSSDAEEVSPLVSEKIDLERAADEDADSVVVKTRNDMDNYLGLADSFWRIYTEEGWSTFYRMWWLGPIFVMS